MSGGNFKRRFRKERSNRDSFFRAGGADPGKAVCRGNGRVGDGAAGGGTGCGMIRSSRGGAGRAGTSSAGSGGGGGRGTGADGFGGDDGLSWAGP